MIIQPKTKEIKQPVGSKFTPKLERAVEKEQHRWGGVSRSFVIAEAVAFALNVDLGYSYKEFKK